MKRYEKDSLIRQIYTTFALIIAVTLVFALLFYRISFLSLRNKESRYMTNMLTQVAQQAEDITASIRLIGSTIANSNAAVHLLGETNMTQKLEYKQSLNKLIAEMSKSNPSAEDILLIDLQGKVYGFSSYDYSLASQLNQKYHLFSSAEYTQGFTGALTISDSTYYAYIEPVYEKGVVTPEASEKLGSCLILCSCDPLYKACGNTASSENSLFFILDTSDQIIAQNQRENQTLDPEIIHSLLARDELSFSEKVNGRSHLIHQQPSLPDTGWKVSSVVPYSDISSDLNKVRIIAYLFFFILFSAFGILMWLIMKNLTHPLLRIVDFTQHDAYYALHHSLEIDGPLELRNLAGSINQMLKRINELNRTVIQNHARLYEIELANNRAQLYALQSQINPHFLYNTLNTIQGLTYLGKDEEIRTAIGALSFVMRYSIKGDEIVLVNDEIQCIEKYKQIIDIRFSRRMQISISVDDSIRNCKMPRFLLQPLVENAVFHGLEPRPGKGNLTLTGTLVSGSILHFVCTDDGVGIAAEKLAELQTALHDDTQVMREQNTHEHVGLLNIHQRLQLMYGPAYGISLSSKPGEGTVVCLDFPFEPEGLSVREANGL